MLVSVRLLTWDSCLPFPCAFATGEAWSLVEPSPVFRRRMEARVTHAQSWLCDRTCFRWTPGACAWSCLFCVIKSTEQKIRLKFYSWHNLRSGAFCFLGKTGTASEYKGGRVWSQVTPGWAIQCKPYKRKMSVYNLGCRAVTERLPKASFLALTIKAVQRNLEKKKLVKYT